MKRYKLQKLKKIRKIFSKPLGVVLFRVKQELILSYKYYTNFWQAYPAIANEYLDLIEDNHLPLLINFKRPILSENQYSILERMALNTVSSNFNILGHQVPPLETCDFSSDWRFGKVWEKMYFKQYQFYEENKKVPYDVKFPWELSRMGFLLPVLAWQWINGFEKDKSKWVLSFLSRWRLENPLAFSVNWYPMEASMRLINLTLLRDLVYLLLKDEENDLLFNLNKILKLMILEHGEFIWANREISDIRGNHFTANLLALLLAGYSVGDKLNKCRMWREYATKHLNRELSLQFCEDGVNFEKTCCYHKLVLEFFLLAAIVRKRLKIPFSQTQLSLLKKALEFSESVMRPDGLAANFGDNDNAVALPFALNNHRSHMPVIELGRAFFTEDIGCDLQQQDEDKLPALFILGFAHIISQPCIEKKFRIFPHGGYVIARDREKGFFFMTDIGEVGMHGRGGHGHNDLLSFELCINGQPLIIDPGCSGYTSDLGKKEYYRRTSTHATIELFDQEMARLNGYWNIYNDARPIDIKIVEYKNYLFVHAGHDGYDRCALGTRIWRTFKINIESEEVVIQDRISLPIKCRGCWNFPLSPDIELEMEPDRGIIITSKGTKIIFKANLPLTLETCLISPGYGEELKGKKIVAQKWLQPGTHEFIFHISTFGVNFRGQDQDNMLK